MKVTCTAVTAANLPDEYLDPRANLHRKSEFALALGTTYVVYAIAFLGDRIWFYIDDEDRLYYPRSYPAPLFDVVDSRVSRYWHFAKTVGHLDHHALLAISEWSEDPYFYDRLTDREKRTCEIFEDARRSLNREFVD